ncbi:MAG: three-Cys-motif partner protein TcmP [Verrucomicrobiota bacterium]
MADSDKMNFGGPWSGQKLDALRRYLTSYTTALSNKSFKLAYIDAFAGAGVQERDGSEDAWFSEEFAAEEERYRSGSPLIALETDPAFDAFIFIEQNTASIQALREQIQQRWGSGQRQIAYLQGDANQHLADLTRKNWTRHRAVAFLDPFALQVSWATLERIAQTQAIDTWLLFPAMAVNRMLPKSGEIPSAWADRLSVLFGESGWRDVFYHSEGTDLFGDEPLRKVDRIFDRLSDYVTARLGTISAGTTDKPLVLRNRGGAPLFLLCFACGNPKGAGIATRIASHIIDKTGHGK